MPVSEQPILEITLTSAKFGAILFDKMKTPEKVPWENKRVVLDFQGQIDKKMKELGRDITYEELKEKTKLSPRTISRLYKGQAGRMKLLETLFNYFECEPNDLIKLK